MRWISIAAAAAATLFAQSAFAEPVEIGQIALGHTYYNRPGATLADQKAELAACVADTGAYTPGVETGRPAQDIATNLLWSGPIAGVAGARVENCMIVRGWRVVRLPEAEGRAFDDLTQAALAEKLAPWIGAAEPHGQIVRAFANEAAHPTAMKLASRPARPGRDQLSLRLFDATQLPSATEPPRAVTLDPKWSTRPLKEAEVPLPPADAGVILVRVKGISNHYGTGVAFAREGVTPEALPSDVDHAPNVVWAGTGFLFAKREGNWFALVVPPGRWRLSNSAFLNLCLGSPSFELKPGEVIYAGTWNLAGDDLGPDLTMAPAQAYLKGPAAERLKPAVYRNGSRGSCHAFPVSYALEIPGAPFAPDYHWGSLAQRPQ